MAKRKFTPDDIAALLATLPQDYLESELGDILVERPQEFPSDPVEFLEKSLGVVIWDKIEKIAKSVENNQYTVVESGHSVGKTLVTAGLSCWWMTSKTDPLLVTMAPTHKQLNNILWRYIRRFGYDSKLPGTIFETPRWDIGVTGKAVGLSPRKSSAEDIATMQGFHGKNLLIIMDEAAGMSRLIYEGVKSLATDTDNRVLAIGNHIGPSGPFWEATESPLWNKVSISCLEHPNVVQRQTLMPGAVSWEWIDDRIHDWCTPCEQGATGSIEWNNRSYIPGPIFTARVMGKAPSESDTQLISLAWVLNARSYEFPMAETVMGFDPARLQDDAVICVRSGNQLVDIKRIKGNKTEVLVDWVIEVAKKWHPTRIFVDGIGIGAGVVDGLRVKDMPVVDVQAAGSADNSNRYANKRAECWSRMRNALEKETLGLTDDPMLMAELISVHYGFDSRGRIQIESKDAIKSRIGRSPDTADALSLTFTYDRPGVEVTAELNRKARQLGGAGMSRWIVSGRRETSRWGRFGS